jgi:hypothetical protein
MVQTGVTQSRWQLTRGARYVPDVAKTADPLSDRVGLCASCRHARRITSSKGSVFFLCERAKNDPRFRKYPPLPVRACPGHEPEPSDG